jgi:hypothetical protein
VSVPAYLRKGVNEEGWSGGLFLEIAPLLRTVVPVDMGTDPYVLMYNKIRFVLRRRCITGLDTGDQTHHFKDTPDRVRVSLNWGDRLSRYQAGSGYRNTDSSGTYDMGGAMG